LGILFAHSFGSRFDYEVQQTGGFKALDGFAKFLVEACLNFFHHWWMGGFLWLYAEEITLTMGIPWIAENLSFFGVGVLIDDIKDVQHLIERYNWWKKVNPDDVT
jgi:hypothetical protein